MQGIEHEARPPSSAIESTLVSAEAQPVWKRSHLIWFLVALSMVPGVVAAAFRPEWVGLPAGVRMTAYIVSGILIVAACGLMLRDDPATPSARESRTTTSDGP
ncbi:MAG TPA: hypothetical protein VFJ81_06450 [Gemmatimonadales bacterium]|nr:hypothetical protein [Gemmatimonadales bacterium]